MRCCEAGRQFEAEVISYSRVKLHQTTLKYYSSIDPVIYVMMHSLGTIGQKMTAEAASRWSASRRAAIWLALCLTDSVIPVALSLGASSEFQGEKLASKIQIGGIIMCTSILIVGLFLMIIPEGF